VEELQFWFLEVAFLILHSLVVASEEEEAGWHYLWVVSLEPEVVYFEVDWEDHLKEEEED